jgi:hypothetical protein
LTAEEAVDRNKNAASYHGMTLRMRQKGLLRVTGLRGKRLRTLMQTRIWEMARE